MGDAATLLSRVATGKSQEVLGEVTVTATDLLSASILRGLLSQLRSAAPGVRVRIVASSDVQSLTKQEADIAICHVRPEQPDLLARGLSDAARGIEAQEKENIVASR